MPLKTKTNGGNQKVNIVGDRASNIQGVTERANAIFELPSTRKTILYHHALAGFSIKETFLNAVWAGNYATWPGLTIVVLRKYFPHLDEMQKRTHERPATRNPFNEAKSIRSPGGIRKTCKNKSGTRHRGGVLSAKCHNGIFVRIKDLAESIHSDQTRRVSMHLAAKQLLCHDCDPSGCKLHFLRANEEQIGG